jgi:L-lactate dehydrogenase complex protein LldE
MEGPQVQLFVTCVVDSLAPEVGRATLKALERAGCSVSFALGQGCCGQPAFNVGLLDDARMMAAQTLDVLDDTEGAIIVPSGSCAAMISHHYRVLFAGTGREEKAKRVGERVRELTQYLVDDLDTGLSGQADRLLEGTQRLVLQDDKECCGFGGLFSIEMPAVSTAIMNKKLDAIESSGADTVVGGDLSCLIHIGGGLRRRGSATDVKHIALLLGDGS